MKRLSDCPAQRLAECRGTTVTNDSPAEFSNCILGKIPVPPAGGEVKVLVWHVRARIKGALWQTWPYEPKGFEVRDTEIRELVDRAHVIRLQADVERLTEDAHQDGLLRVRYGQQIDQLKADNEVLTTAIIKQADETQSSVSRLLNEQDALQSELTKVNEELRLEKIVSNAMRNQANDYQALHWHQKVELTEARELLTQGAYFGPGVWGRQVLDFLAHQSAPAAKCKLCNGFGRVQISTVCGFTYKPCECAPAANGEGDE